MKTVHIFHRWTSAFLLRVWSPNQQHISNTWSLLGMQTLGPTPALLNWNLHFYKMLLPVTHVNAWEALDPTSGSQTWACIVGSATCSSSSSCFSRSGRGHRICIFRKFSDDASCCGSRDHTLRTVRLKHPFHCTRLCSLLIPHSSK